MSDTSTVSNVTTTHPIGETTSHDSPNGDGPSRPSGTISPSNSSARQHRKRRVAASIVITVLAAGLVAGGVAVVRGNAEAGAAESTDDPATLGDPPETAVVERGDLTAESDFRGSVGFGDEWTIPLDGGIVTASQPTGTLVNFGEPLVTIDALPVLLVQGDVPMYRDLELLSTPITGADVFQLQQMLIGLGFDRDGELTADGKFGIDTKRAVEDWQEANWWPKTGRIAHDEIVFSPVPLRVAGDLRVGTAFAGIDVTEWTPAVTVDIANRDRNLLQLDSEVTVELDDGTTTGGVVTDQRTVTADDGSTSTRVTITPEGVTGDATTARVVVTNTEASDVLLVPVGALLAVAQGGYALEVIESAGDAATRLVAVQIGAILDGRVEVTGDITAGDEIVVAG
jgi:peptidoglycan hydrolase-like protein with peptidoglycan-binding domain